MAWFRRLSPPLKETVMLLSRTTRRGTTAFAALVLGILSACSNEQMDNAVLTHATPQAVANPGDIVAGTDAGAFINAIVPTQATRNVGAFWDNISADGISPYPVSACNAGYFAVGLLPVTCGNEISPPNSFNNQGGFAGGTYWGKTADATKPASFMFNGANSYTVTQLGGWRGGNSEVGWFEIVGGNKVFHAIPAWGNGTGVNTAIVVPAGNNWGFYIRNTFNPQIGGCGDADTDCSDATGDWNDPPPARQQFALFMNSTSNRFLVAGEDNQLLLEPNGANLDSDYNDYFWSVTRNAPPPPLDLTITKGTSGTAAIGQQVTYTVQGVNNSAIAANNVVVVDTLPVGATFVSASDGGSYNAGNRVATGPTIPVLAANTNTTAYTVTVTYAAAGSYKDNAHIFTSSTETNTNNNHADATTVVPPPQTGNDQGCSPGYWKNHDSWPSPYTKTTQFSAVFENAFPGMTLQQVLEQGGGGLASLGRHIVSGLLNAKALGVNHYGETAAQVIANFNAAFPGTKAQYEALGSKYEGMEDVNGRKCPLN